LRYFCAAPPADIFERYATPLPLPLLLHYRRRCTPLTIRCRHYFAMKRHFPRMLLSHAASHIFIADSDAAMLICYALQPTFFFARFHAIYAPFAACRAIDAAAAAMRRCRILRCRDAARYATALLCRFFIILIFHAFFSRCRLAHYFSCFYAIFR
jgi:hypothetical protein